MAGILENDKSFVVMKVFITYTTDGQIAIIKGLIESLDKGGIDSIAWNRTTFKYYTNSYKSFKKNIFYIKLYSILPRIIFAILTHFYIFNLLLVNTLFADSDILNYHFHDNFLDRLLFALRRKNKKVMVSIWGSDLYRISKKTIDRRSQLYELVNLIHVESPGVKDDFLSTYSTVDKSKVVSCNFGISLFELIDNYINKKSLISKEILPPEAQGKIIVTCGYNARKGQQHSKIIHMLSSLPVSCRNKLFIVFPLTYTVKGDSYIEKIDSDLSNFNIPYKCFREELNLDELAKIRIVSDIVINIQISDALSSSLVEYFYCGNIMILGDWLPYSFLKFDFGLEFIPISLDNMRDKFIDVLSNYPYYKAKGEANIIKVYDLANWNSVSKRFLKIFTELFNS